VELLDLRALERVASRAVSDLFSDRFEERAMPGPELEDAVLLGRTARGDAAAFGSLFDRHSGLVLGLLVRLLGRRAEAEELLQEVFLQVWREADRYRPEAASPRGWLLMIARSRAIDRLRSHLARERREAAAAGPADAAVAPTGPERLERRERRARVAAALAGLPPEQREAVEHAFFQGLSHREIAERLGQPLGTVKSRILLGMRKLRASLEAP
jgi:RNA polymerase sigma-70 factor (ECF subfamily)